MLKRCFFILIKSFLITFKYIMKVGSNFNVYSISDWIIYS